MSIHRRETKKGVRYDVRLRKPDGTPYSTTFRTKREAERFQAKELTDRDQGTWIDPQAGKITFQQWADEWYSTMTHSWRPSTAARHRAALDEHWIPRLGPVRLSSISSRMIQQAINELSKELRSSTIRSYYGTLRGLLADAVEADLIGRSPCRGIKLPSAQVAARRLVTPIELHELADAIGPRWRCLIYLGGVMGLRFGEAVALTRSGVDTDAATIQISHTVSEVKGHLRIGPPKTAASFRTLSLPKALAVELDRHLEVCTPGGPESPVFQDDDGGYVRRSNFRTRVWLPALEAAGLQGLTFHGLRHSAATAWIAQGVDARTVQHLLGHSDPRLVLRLYAHAQDEGLRLAAQAVGARYWPE